MSEAMSDAGAEARAADEAALDAGARVWWVFLVTGGLWLLFAIIVLRFNWASVSSISILFGCTMLAAGLVELLAVFAAHGWARAGHAALALACIVIGVIAFIHPGNTFRALAAVMSFYLIVKGTADVILSLAFRDVELWWLRLITGLIEVVIGFWAAGYWGRSVTLLLVWIGVIALTRGIGEIVLAFSLRRVARA